MSVVSENCTADGELPIGLWPGWCDEPWEPGDRNPVTRKEAELLEHLIVALRDRPGLPPSERELSDALDVHPWLIHTRLGSLRAKGWVTWEAGKTRTLRLARGRAAAGPRANGEDTE